MKAVIDLLKVSFLASSFDFENSNVKRTPSQLQFVGDYRGQDIFALPFAPSGGLVFPLYLHLYPGWQASNYHPRS